MAYSSKLIEQAIIEVAKLPGIGKKSALRIVLHLLRQDISETHDLEEEDKEELLEKFKEAEDKEVQRQEENHQRQILLKNSRKFHIENLDEPAVHKIGASVNSLDEAVKFLH